MHTTALRIFTTVACVAGIGSVAGVRAQSHAHVLQSPKEATWGPAPPTCRPVRQSRCCRGPDEGRAYSVRLKFPANYDIPAHSHPTDENVVVVSGGFTIGAGDKLVKGAGTKTLGAGGYALAAANMDHFAYTAPPNN